MSLVNSEMIIKKVHQASQFKKIKTFSNSRPRLRKLVKGKTTRMRRRLKKKEGWRLTRARPRWRREA